MLNAFNICQVPQLQSEERPGFSVLFSSYICQEILPTPKKIILKKYKKPLDIHRHKVYTANCQEEVTQTQGDTKYNIHRYKVRRTTMNKTTNRIALEKAITWKMTGKLEGFASLSTSPLCNAHCIERMKSDVAVCRHCFSARMQKRYANLRAKLERNTELLTKTELKPEDIPFLNMAFFRFESFGDLNNTLQVKNYFLIAEQNPHCTMALWTKNPWIIADAMEEYGISKPENLIIILSSVLLNTSADADQVSAKYPFVDKVFTVYDKDHAENVEINCGARSCASCQRCYHKADGIEYVNELLK